MHVGRRKGKYTQGFRLLRMMEMLQSRNYITIEMLKKEFDISRRTAHRDLSTLQENYVVQEAGWLESGQKSWHIPSKSGKETLKLTIMEMAALYMGKNLFNFTEGTQLKESIDSIFAKVSHRLASNRASYQDRLEYKFYCTPGAPKNYEKFDDQLNEILTGLLEEQKVSIIYQSPGNTSYNSTIHPWTLVIHNHALYVIAFSEKANNPRIFALERIEEATWQRGKNFDYPDSFKPEEYLSHAFGIMVGSPVKLILRPSREILEYFRNRKWHSSQQIKIDKNGDELISLDVPETAELLSWILSFGNKIEVLQPPSVRRKVKKMAISLYLLYGEGEA